MPSESYLRRGFTGLSRGFTALGGMGSIDEHLELPAVDFLHRGSRQLTDNQQWCRASSTSAPEWPAASAI